MHGIETIIDSPTQENVSIVSPILTSHDSPNANPDLPNVISLSPEAPSNRETTERIQELRRGTVYNASNYFLVGTPGEQQEKAIIDSKKWSIGKMSTQMGQINVMFPNDINQKIISSAVDVMHSSLQLFKNYLPKTKSASPIGRLIFLPSESNIRCYANGSTAVVPSKLDERTGQISSVIVHEWTHLCASLLLGESKVGHFTEGIATLSEMLCFPRSSNLPNLLQAPGRTEINTLLNQNLVPFSATGLLRNGNRTSLERAQLEYTGEYRYYYGSAFAMGIVKYLTQNNPSEFPTLLEASTKYIDIYAVSCEQNLFDSETGKQLIKDGQVSEEVTQEEITKECLRVSGIDPDDPILISILKESLQSQRRSLN